jgi:predicted nucleic acid-binding protein
MDPKRRVVLDVSVLAAVVNSDDTEHLPAYSYFKNCSDQTTWVVPGVAFFEFQATQSRRQRERSSGHPPFRHAPLYYENCELYNVTREFLKRVWEMELYDRFSFLKGADLLYACIARVESIPLVTHDADFNRYAPEISIIKPREYYHP